MTNGGFLDQSKRTNKTGLTIVIAGHVAALAAIALAPPEMVQRITFLPTMVTSIREPAPPPPDQPPPPPRHEQQRQSRPASTDPIVKTGGDPVLTFDPTPPAKVDPLPLPPLPAEPLMLPATIEPSAMAHFQPDYPSALVRAELEGSATVRVLIGSDGRVKAVEPVNATDPGFFEATKKQALRFWRFKAATRDGVAIESWRTMTVRFRLQN